MVRWGIAGSGFICHDFVNSLKAVKDTQVIAVAARSKESAETFATKHGITKIYTNYSSLAEDPEVDIIYIGTIHPTHKEIALQALRNKKNVLCEKPICLNASDTVELIKAARENNVFLMEAMWTRFFPAIRKVRSLLNEGVIGDVCTVTCSFGFAADFSVKRLFDLEMGGGGLLDIGCYPVAMASMVFGGVKPQAIVAAGHLHETGADINAGIVLKYPTGIATLTYTLKGNPTEETVITGSRGCITIHSPFHCPSRVTLSKQITRTESVSEVFDFPLIEIPTTLPFNFPNSEGMAYEGEAVQECVVKGLKESPEFPLDETLTIMEIMDEVRKQIGVKYPGEQ